MYVYTPCLNMTQAEEIQVMFEEPFTSRGGRKGVAIPLVCMGSGEHTVYVLQVHTHIHSHTHVHVGRKICIIYIYIESEREREEDKKRTRESERERERERI